VLKSSQFELSQRFYFEAAHTLRRSQATGEAESSRRIHGHTYEALVTICGVPDEHGMVMDLALLRAAIARVRDKLDHHFLDEIEGLGPATLENLCVFIARQLNLSGIASVSVERHASGDRCVLRLPTQSHD
jgi:6-pyruvoyltetrahydropterin/6-carboxytetrahydropterin synthase